MESTRYLFFMSQIKPLREIKENKKIKISLVFYEGIESTCVLKQYKNRNLSDVCQGLMEIKHPNITLVYDYVYENGNTYVLEEFVMGNSLQEVMEEKGIFSEKETKQIIIQICSALEILHSRKPPIIHNDIKTSNIMVRDDGGIKLIDFDISRTYKEGADKNTHLYGTKEYASPEHFGFGQSEPRSDIYSLGVTMHEMLTGRGLTSEHKITYKGKLAKVIRKCIEVDRKKRYLSVRRLKQNLERNRKNSFLLLLKTFCYGYLLILVLGIAVILFGSTSDSADKQGENIVSEEENSIEQENNALAEADSAKENNVEEQDAEGTTSKSVADSRKMLVSDQLEGSVESVLIIQGKELILQNISGKHYVSVDNTETLLEGLSEYSACKLVYDSYSDSLYLFEYKATETEIYTVGNNFKITHIASISGNTGVTSDSSCSFFSDGMMICESWWNLFDSNTWTKIGKCPGEAYIINDRMFEPVYNSSSNFCYFVEVDMQGNTIKECKPDEYFEGAVFMSGTSIYVDKTYAYFIATLEAKEYVYRFDGESYEAIMCLNDYQYYTPFSYKHLCVNEGLVLCYDSSTEVIKKFEL